MSLEYFIDSSDIKKIMYFTIKYNNGIKEFICEKFSMIKMIKFSTFLTLIFTCPAYFLWLSAYIFPDNNGSYFSLFSLYGYKILINILINILVATVIIFLFICLIFKLSYVSNKKREILEYILEKYSFFKGVNKLTIKEDSIYVNLKSCNIVIEKNIIEKIIKYDNVIYFLDKKQIPLLFIPLEQLNIDVSKLIYFIEKHLNIKVSEG